MSSLWTDLLFLHRHLARKEDLAWCQEKSAEDDDETVSTANPSEPAFPPPQHRKLHWPRVSVPR